MKQKKKKCIVLAVAMSMFITQLSGCGSVKEAPAGAMTESNRENTEAGSPEKDLKENAQQKKETYTSAEPASTPTTTPTLEPTTKPTPEPTPEPTPDYEILDFSKATVGRTISFGHYDQDGYYYNGKENIEWEVLDKQEDKLLVLSNYFLDCQPFDNTGKTIDEVNWENSSIRAWLNDYFLYNAFSEAERNAILDTVIDEPDCGEPNVNKIFLLSYEEYKAYINSDRQYNGMASKLSFSYNGHPEHPENRTNTPRFPHYSAGWLLRSKGEDIRETPSWLNEPLEPYRYIHNAAITTFTKISPDIKRFIRPAMWLPTVIELKDTEEDVRPIQGNLSQLSYGDKFTFGAYEQDGNYANGKEEMEWYVLEKQNDRLLALSAYAFDTDCYSKVLRSDWLEYKFYYEGFTKAERELIVPGYNIRNVSLLTKEQYEKYFTYSYDIPAGTTLWNGTEVFWALEDTWGGIGTSGYYWEVHVNRNDTLPWIHNVVRPVIWIHIDENKQEHENAQGGSATVKVNDIIEFGSYEQDNDLTNGKEAISWIVLNVIGNQAFVVSSKVLDSQPYNNDDAAGRSWAKCTLRTWLNSDFYDEAFTEDEKSRILNVETSKALYTRDILESEKTYDNVFCLCADDIKNYRVTTPKPTRYAESLGVFDNDGSEYWLRGLYATVQSFGNAGDNIAHPESSRYGVGVRPAMWIEIP